MNSADGVRYVAEIESTDSICACILLTLMSTVPSISIATGISARNESIVGSICMV